MALTKISGAVSNFREETQVTSAQTSNMGQTSFKSHKQINFRIGNSPVSMKLSKGMELTNGDEATVVGTSSGGGITALLIRNDTTGIIYGYGRLTIMIWGIILTVIGVATLAIFIGIFLTPLGVYLLYKGNQHMQAHTMMAV